MNRGAAGFSLFELLIAVAVIGIVAAVAVPAYRSYIDTANMSKVTSHFEEGVRLARITFTKSQTRVAMGLPETAPTSTEAWIELLNPGGAEAPGGGPAYIASNNSPRSRGDQQTGAIGVQYVPAFRNVRPPMVILWRPLYKGLSEQMATINTESVNVRVLREPAS